MNTKDFTDPDAAIRFVKELQENNTVDISKLADGTFRITWLENKQYISIDNKEYTDEVWTKEDGTMIACQDLDHEHAKNIIRMILRQDRESRAAEAQMYNLFQSTLDAIPGVDYSGEDGLVEQRVLH